MRLTIFAAWCVLAVSACETSDQNQGQLSLQEKSSPDIEAFAKLMTGEFETAPDDPDNSIRDRRMRLNSPDLNGIWLYYQLNTGEEKKVYRQRVISLTVGRDHETIIQKTYGLIEPETYVDLWENPKLSMSISPQDIEEYFESGCEQRWKPSGDGWKGYVDPSTCKIFSERRQADISIQAEAQLSQDTYRQTERGFDADGAQLFGTEPGEFITLYRQ